MVKAIDEFAKRFAESERRLAAVERSAQTAFRSVESGAIDINADDGSTVATVGQLSDGRVGLADLVTSEPPTPSVPDATAGVGTINVAWDGGYVDALPTGITIAYAGVHVNQDPGDVDWEPTVESEVSQITWGGGSVVLPGDAGVETAVCLVTVTAAGVWSEPTDPVLVTPEYALTAEDIPAPTDGAAPTGSPTTTVEPFAIGAVRASWPAQANSDPVMYDVYASLTSPVTTADELVTSTSALYALVDRLDGSRLPMTEPGTPVYVAVIARDADGAADIGTEGSASAILADNEFISALYAYFGDVEASQITSGVINALTQIGVGSDIVISQPSVGVTPLTGGIVVLDPDNPTGEPLVRLHPEGCTFRGKVTTDVLTVLQDLVINGQASLSSGGSFTIENGVSDPPAGPILAQGPLNAQDWPPTPVGHARKGICWDAVGSQWVEMLLRTSDNLWRYRTVSTLGVPGPAVAFVHSMTGLGLGSRPFLRMGGITVIGANIYTTAVYDMSFGDELYVLHKATFSTGGHLGEVMLTAISGAFADAAVGNDGTDPIVAFYESNGDGYVVQKHSNSTLALVGRSKLSDYTNGQVGRYVAIGDFGYGSPKLTVGHETHADVYPLPGFTGDSLTKDAARSWDMDATVTNGGLAYKTSGSDQGFYSTHNDAKLWRWSSYYPLASEQFWVKYLDIGGGDHTAPSPARSIAVAKRRFATATLRDPLSGVTGADTFVGYGATPPGTFFKRPETLSGRTLVMTSGKDTSGSTTVPSTNTLGGSPSVLEAEVGGFVVRGDSSGDWPGVIHDARAVPTGMSTNASGYITLAVTPALVAMPTSIMVIPNNSQLVAIVDMANSTPSSLRIYFRNITSGGAVVTSGAVGAFTFVAFP